MYFLDGIASLTTPVVFAIKSGMCDETDQGLIQGALAGIQSLAMTLAPLVY